MKNSDTGSKLINVILRVILSVLKYEIFLVYRFIVQR